MSVKTRVLGDTQQEVMDYNKEKKKLFESALPDSLNITWWMICQRSPFVSHASTLSYNTVEHCVSQCLIRMAWSEQSYSEKGVQQLLLQVCYPW